MNTEPDVFLWGTEGTHSLANPAQRAVLELENNGLHDALQNSKRLPALRHDLQVMEIKIIAGDGLNSGIEEGLFGHGADIKRGSEADFFRPTNSAIEASLALSFVKWDARTFI